MYGVSRYINKVLSIYSVNKKITYLPSYFNMNSLKLVFFNTISWYFFNNTIILFLAILLYMSLGYLNLIYNNLFFFNM